MDGGGDVEVVLALAVLAVLLLPTDVLRFGATTPAPEPGPAAALLPLADDTPDGLFSREFVQWRLDVLADELARLDGDPGVMARGFRTTVALTAYQALLADAAALREPADPGAGSGDVEFELL